MYMRLLDTHENPSISSVPNSAVYHFHISKADQQQGLYTFHSGADSDFFTYQTKSGYQPYPALCV